MAFAEKPVRKHFGKGSPFTIKELPAGKLKAKLQTLNPQARGKAMNWLHTLSFEEFDAAGHLRVDKDGGIYIVCPDGHGNCDGQHHKHAETNETTTESIEEESTKPTEEPTTANAAVSISSPPAYNSKPGATRHIYLDFNGALVSGKAWSSTDGTTTWTSWDCAAWGTDADATTFSDSEQAEMRRVWERISEDYAPFDVNVTTDVAYDSVTYTGDKNKVGWLLFTAITDKLGARCPHYGSGGIAYVGVFGNSNFFSTYQPAWVTPTGSANMAEAASHEMGHNMGLSHDGLITGAAYYGGHAAVTGVAPSWGPIMGTGYNRNVSQWSKASEYYNGNQTQDDLSIISARVPYLADDHGSTFGTATAWTTGTVNQPAIIERTNDIDTFTFNAGAGTISLNAATYKCDSGTWGGNLDILLELYDNSQILIASNNPADQVNASVSVSVPAGRYYVMVKPVAAGSSLSSTPSGYTVYGSLGKYKITGSFVPEDGILINSPGGGEAWVAGVSYPITWGSAMGGNVEIELLKAGSLHSTITTSAPNNGSYSWAIPSGITLANDYKVRITSVEQPTKSDQSASNFTITTDPLADALDTTGMLWTTSGSLPWYRQTATTKDGVDAAQSGAITHDQTSTMETTIVGPGTMTFWWKVSSESGYDFLRFFLNGVEQTGSLARISGTVEWLQKTVSIPSGSNVVSWSYTKDQSVSSGSDTAWVDQVVFTPSSAPEIAVEQPAGTNLTDGSSTANFGSVSVGSSSELTFTIKNAGTADLTSLALTKSGTHSADYTLGSLSTTTLAAGASTTFTVTFAPGVAGTRTAALQIASNDADENPFDISLTGNGLGPGTLDVAGTGGLSSSGNYGGAFSPSSIQYTLSNPGSTSINWTAAKTQNWVTLSATSGTLASGANTTVTVTINSNANTLNAGSHNDTVTFTNTTNNGGNTSRAVALTVNPASATVTLGNLSQTYDGSPKPVSVTTNPVGLSTSVTYDGSATVPINTGTYAVVATITNPNYTGSDSKSLVISKASQTITFNALDSVGNDQSPFALTGSASSGLMVAFTSSNTSVATVSGNTVTIVAAGTTNITASQSGNQNYLAATNVVRELQVVPVNPVSHPGGPYKVLVGQSLALDGSASTASFGETLTAYSWDLNNDGTFGDVTGATPAAIPFDDLINVWGLTQGLNTIQLRVTDSSAKTDTVSTTVELALALQWDANGTTAGQTNGGGAWLGTNLWWDGAANVNWAPGSNAIFGGPSTAGGSVTLASPTTVNALVFETFTGTYTLGTAGQMLTLNDGINKTSTSATVSIISPVILSGAQSWSNQAGAMNFTGGVDLNGHLLSVDGAGTTTFSGTSNIITGSGGITMSGTGRLNLGAGGTTPAHDYSGITNLNGGVTMHNNNPSPNSNITLNGGVLETYWTTNFTRALGTGDTQVRIIGGESGFSHNAANGNTVNLGGAAAMVTWGSANFDPTKFVLQSAYSQNNSNLTFANALNLNGATRTIFVNPGASNTARAILSGAISNSTGTAGLIKQGAGMLNLTHASSSWNGSTSIENGILDFGGVNMASIGGGSGRNISVTAGTGVRFNTLSNAILNRIAETSAEIAVMTGTTSNNLDFGSSSGANLPNAFLGNWAGNGAKTEYSGTITPAADAYRLGSPIWNNGLLGLTDSSTMTGSRGLIIGGGSVELVGPKTFTGDTVIRSGGRLGLAAISGGSGTALALQNSPLDVGSSGGTFWLESGGASGPVTGSVATTSALFGGLKGSRSLASVYSTSTGANNSAATAVTSITGFTLNPGNGVLCEYSGAIGEFATGTTLTKTGQGAQILAGANTFTGATLINVGSLLVNGSLSNVAASLNVANGATLGGSGTIGRNVTIADAGKLEFNISTNAASHDRLDISSGRDFAFAGSSVLTITSSGGASTGTYTLVTGGNNITGLAPVTLNLPSGWAATVSISGNSLLLNVTSLSGGTPGSLAVASTEGLSSVGSLGGPFSPSSIQYTLNNPGQNSINWTAGKTAAWVDLSATSGTLAAGAETTVTVSINSNANSLVAGSYNDMVTFTNSTNGTGDTTRGVSLMVNALGTYTVSYNGNGNTSGAAPSDQTKTENEDLVLASQGTLARTGYSFTGWNTAANGSGTPYAAGGTYSANASVTLHAQWTANDYTVTFDPNGGETPSSTSKSVTHDSTYGTLATVNRTGYAFNGWFTATSGGTLVTASNTVTATANHTLYAQWTINTYTVSYATNESTSGTAPASQTKTHDTDLTLATNTGDLARTGYTFSGWNTLADGSGITYNEGGTYAANEDLILYAKWTANTYTVTFDANGGSAPVPTSKLVTFGSTYDGLATTNRTDYLFNGWYTEITGGSLVTSGTSVTTDADHTLHARWTQLFVEMDVTRNSTLVPSGGYDSFAGSSVGTGGKLNYEIANGGTDALTLGSVVISATSNCAVDIDSQPTASVEPSSTGSMVLTVTPSAAGAWSFTATIPNNTPDKNPYQWTVHGVAANSGSVELTAVADTWINAASTGTNYGILPNTTFSIYDRIQGQSSLRRFGLLRFDLSSIPDNATITSASLGLVQSNTNAGLVEIFNVTSGWIEEEATWATTNTFVGSTSYGSESAPGTTNGIVPGIVLNDAGLNMVRSWMTGTNYGFGVKTTNSGNNTNIDLHTREATVAAHHPKLTIAYTVDPQVSEMNVMRGGSSVANEGTDAVSNTMSGGGTQLTYAIANLGNVNLTLTTPVSVSSASNCAVVVDSQPADTVVPSTHTNLVLTVTPSASGAWSVNVFITNNDLDEAPYNWIISGTAQTSFASFISDPIYDIPLEEQGFNDDPDGDGIANGLEAFFGTHPGESSSGLASPSSNGTTTTFTHPRNPDMPVNLTISYEWSPNLMDWYTGDGVAGPAQGQECTISSETISETTTVTAVSTAAQQRIFLRAVVTQN